MEKVQSAITINDLNTGIQSLVYEISACDSCVATVPSSVRKNVLRFTRSRQVNKLYSYKLFILIKFKESSKI